jgi:hypothetical protein
VVQTLHNVGQESSNPVGRGVQYLIVSRIINTSVIIGTGYINYTIQSDISRKFDYKSLLQSYVTLFSQRLSYETWLQNSLQQNK